MFIQSIARLAGRALRRVRSDEMRLAKVVLGAPETMQVHSAAFGHEAPIPAVHTSSEGDDVSPPLAWSDPPAGTRELVLLVEDPDIPGQRPFSHWVVYKIPAHVRGLRSGIGRENSPEGAMQGVSSMRRKGYLGPHPPPGHGTHHYHFQVFALDAPLHLDGGASRDEVVKAMEGRVIACGDLVGTYGR